MTREASSTPPPGDDLDQLLGAFFRSEMPDPWPGLEPPLSRAVTLPPPRQEAPPRRSSLHAQLFQSRLALAASVAVLLGGLWLVGAVSVSVEGPQPTLGPPEATHKSLPVPTTFSLEQGADGRTSQRVTAGPEDGFISPDK